MYKTETENYNSTMLTACKNLFLPGNVNFVYIGIVCFFWLVSNLELFLEAHFDFMPWNKFHVRWQIEKEHELEDVNDNEYEHKNEQEHENEHKNDNEPENFKNETSMNKEPVVLLSYHNLNLV